MALLANTALPKIEVLGLFGNDLTDEVLPLILNAPWLPWCKTIYMHDNRFTLPAIHEFRAHAAVQHLEQLSIA